jgi:hypothetical protein
MSQSEAPPAQPVPPVRPAAGQDRFLLAIVAGTLLLVVVGVVVVFMFGRTRAAPPADPNSPAGVVYNYVEAVRAGDVDRARGFLTAPALADFDSRTRTSPVRPSSNDNVRIVVETVTTTETTAEVKITISRFYARNDPFSSNTSHRNLTARLIREDGAWKISQALLPYELY